jgi:AcrR family transcriptional regulator
MYGARLPHEDARVIDDYAEANKLDRAEAVRQALHLFALRQKMLRTKKDPLRESLEQVVAEQLGPVRQRTEEMMAMLNDLASFIVEQDRSLPGTFTEGGNRQTSSPHDEGSAAHPYTQFFSGQKQLLEQTLMLVMLALRLHVNYLIEPVLSVSEARSDDEAERHLRAAIVGPEEWCGTTRKVVARTGKRLLFESKLITPEEWERLLDEYRAEDGRGAPR